MALLPDRKLRFFEEQPLARVPPGREGDRVLLQYVVEDAMKRRCVPSTQQALCAHGRALKSKDASFSSLARAGTRRWWAAWRRPAATTWTS